MKIQPHEASTVQRHGRGRAIRIATVLAGLAQLVLAALLIGIPAGSPTLDEVPVPEGVATTPSPAALAVHPTATPVRPTPRAYPATNPTRAPRTTPTARRSRTAPPVAARVTPPRQKTETATVPSDAPTRATKSATTDIPEPSEPSRQHTPPGQTREPPGQADELAQETTHEQPTLHANIPHGQTQK
ncbi:hypothetical protein [Nonomuraea helvata]|uniref:Uncharacterized protein n=1 Tax=Nonomuraea helvata TaxID=37484 RepID=A0ABV5SHS2_9ACTN